MFTQGSASEATTSAKNYISVPSKEGEKCCAFNQVDLIQKIDYRHIRSLKDYKGHIEVTQNIKNMKWKKTR